MTKISILGCAGWGYLWRKLTQNGFSIHGSTTSVEKLTPKKIRNSAFLIALESDKLR
jgi:hypothetical protein